jgi:hypothetical protein
MWDDQVLLVMQESTADGVTQETGVEKATGDVQAILEQTAGQVPQVTMGVMELLDEQEQKEKKAQREVEEQKAILGIQALQAY